MTNFFQGLLLCLLAVSPFYSEAQTNWQETSYEVELPLYDGSKHLGDVKASVTGEKLTSLDKATFLKAIKSYLSADTFKQFEKLPDPIDPKNLTMPLKYDPSELKLILNVDVNQRSTSNLNLMDDYRHMYDGEALRPSPFGGAINYRVEQSLTNDKESENYFSGQFNSFINLHEFVLENQSYYQSNTDPNWFRGDTRLIKDLEHKQIRIQAGDIYPQIQGFMAPKSVGGVSVSRNFTLNPYRLPFPSGEQNFTLNARSMVKYFVNGSLIRSEYLPAGNYTARDIPLNNGLNTIIIEATDDLGQRKVFQFRSSSSINLLNEGESRFDLTHGVPFFDQNLDRTYRYNDGKITTGFFQYGFSPTFSSSVYGQNQDTHSLFGTELIYASSVGNLLAGHANSLDPLNNGHAQSLGYQLIGQGSEWLRAQTLTMRYEHRSTNFKTAIMDLTSPIQNNYALNYTLPLASKLTASLGGNFGDVRDNELSNRYGIDSTLNFRVFDHSNVSFFVSRSRDEFKNWNDVAYVFLTIAFPTNNDFISAFHDQKQKNTKVTYIRDNQNRLYVPRTQGILENNPDYKSGLVDVNLPTPYGDIGGRVEGRDLAGEEANNVYGNIQLNSAFVFAYQDGEIGAGLSRPIANSFVLFKPEPRLKGQKIALKSTSPFTESQTGIFGELSFSSLLAYQYREIQLDPSFMEVGRALKKEKYVVFPTYKSAHLIKLQDQGAVMLKGVLKRSNGEPWALQVGRLSGRKTFFTNRDGEFFIEGVELGHYDLTLDGQETILPVDIPEDSQGIKDVGTLVLEETL